MRYSALNAHPPSASSQTYTLPTHIRSIETLVHLYYLLGMVGIALVAAASWWMYGAAQLVDWDYVLEEAIYKIEGCFFTIMNFPFWLFDTLIEFPLREVYRHGPSIIGWEGEPLPRICARITYHGDEAFWTTV